MSATVGDVYIAGFTFGSLLPDHTRFGNIDAFVRKYNASGALQWTRQFGTSAADYGFGVSATAAAVYVVGQTSGTLPDQSNIGGIDAYVRKYSAGGGEQWTRQFGSPSGTRLVAASATTSGVYVVGFTDGPLPGQTSLGGRDAFVRKYDSNGTEQWTRQFGTPVDDYATAVSATDDGFYLVGYTPGLLPGQTQAGLNDAFLQKYNAGGALQWTRQFGSISEDYAWAVSATGDVVYVAGSTWGTLPGQTSVGRRDVFARKYNSNGMELWTRQFGTATDDDGTAASAVDGALFVTGNTLGTLPGQTSTGLRDAFLRKYDPNGAEQWTAQFGTSAEEYPYGVSARAGGVYVVGDTSGVFPGQIGIGGSDIFLAITSAR